MTVIHDTGHQRYTPASDADAPRQPLAPPFSEEAEQAVLSAMMNDERAIVAMEPILTAESFYRAAHRRLFAAITAMHHAGTRVDPITLLEQLKARAELDGVGGHAYIGALMDAIPTTANVAYHAAIVRERAQQRALLDALHDAEAELHRGASSRELAQHLFRVALPFTVDEQGPGFRHVRELMPATMAAIEQRAAGIVGLKTGYAAIDNWTNGFRPGELFIPAGAEKSGKSAFAFNVGQRVLERENGTVGVAYVSAEMAADSLIERALSRKARIDAQKLGAGRVVDDEWIRLSRAASELYSDPLYIDDEAEPSLADVDARCTYLKALHPEIGLIIVDFLQLVTAREKGISEAIELKRIAYGLKRMAKRLQVVVIAPCQVNSKEVETTKDMRPQLKDLQGSSGMRQAADFIALLYRPSLYDDSGLETDADLLELNFAACRRTPRFTARLRWHGPTLTVTE